MIKNCNLTRAEVRWILQSPLTTFWGSLSKYLPIFIIWFDPTRDHHAYNTSNSYWSFFSRSHYSLITHSSYFVIWSRLGPHDLFTPSLLLKFSNFSACIPFQAITQIHNFDLFSYIEHSGMFSCNCIINCMYCSQFLFFV